MAGRGISRTHAAFWPVLRHSRTAVARLPASWAPVTQHSCSRHDVVAVRFTSERPDSEIPPSQTLSLECIYSFTPRWHLWNGYKTLGDGRAVLPSCQFPSSRHHLASILLTAVPKLTAFSVLAAALFYILTPTEVSIADLFEYARKGLGET